MAQDPRPFGELPATGYVRQSQLIPAPVPFSSATLWRRVKAGTFPKPVKLSERVTAWNVEDVRQWLVSFAQPKPEAAVSVIDEADRASKAARAKREARAVA